MSIKYKIFIPIFIMVFSMILSIGYFNIQNTKENVKKLSIEHLHSLGYITKKRIEQYLKQTEAEVNIFNSSVLLRKTLENNVHESNKEIFSIIKVIIDSSYTNNKTIKDITELSHLIL
ncbi:hypothetical protein [uncultured Arcobacter sp.]|uniref:hypothetical protein n=1 Tax=uncultured Arcobacter sp. TaxID=165434 RepID=UPI002633636C|nr:hypothetical protein [uncultured Arcobacter sp.]